MTDNTSEHKQRSSVYLSAFDAYRPIESSACGKAIIVGEHGAVYGAHAVAMPLKAMRLKLLLKPERARDLNSRSIHLKFGDHEASPRIITVIAKAMDILQLDCQLSIYAESHSTLPIGAGLGSSATLCVAILRALAKGQDKDIDPQTLAHLANELEKGFHGTPSGLDAAVVAMEQCLLFAKNKTMQAIKIPPAQTYNFVLIDSNVRASTMAMIRIAEPFFKGQNGDKNLEAFDRVSLAAHQALLTCDTLGLAAAMNESAVLLQNAGVVPELLQEMIEAARSAGLLALKSTGAGGGGMVLGLLDPERQDQQISRLNEKFGHQNLYVIGLDSH